MAMELFPGTGWWDAEFVAVVNYALVCVVYLSARHVSIIICVGRCLVGVLIK